MTGVVLLEVDGPPMGRQHGVSELSEHSQGPKDKCQRHRAPRKSCGARCAGEALNIGKPHARGTARQKHCPAGMNHSSERAP